MGESDFLPDMGRPEGRFRPIDVSWLFPDADRMLCVELVVMRLQADSIYKPTSKDQHWMISWNLGDTADGRVVRRRLHLVREIGAEHLTNWGAVTTSSNADIELDGVVLPITHMTLVQRRALEEIGNSTGVRRPDGRWNCQDWCQTVLENAVQKGLIQQLEMERAITEGQATQPRPHAPC